MSEPNTPTPKGELVEQLRVALRDAGLVFAQRYKTEACISLYAPPGHPKKKAGELSGHVWFRKQGKVWSLYWTPVDGDTQPLINAPVWVLLAMAEKLSELEEAVRLAMGREDGTIRAAVEVVRDFCEKGSSDGH